jgi:hypothetical protein
LTDLTGEWFTYKQAAELLNVSPEAVRQRAIRGRWQRTIGNDKRIRVWLPEDRRQAIRRPDDGPNARPSRVLDERVPAKRLIKALEAHIESLKAQLRAAEKLAEKQAGDLAVERALANQISARLDQIAAELAAEQAQRVKAEQELAAKLARAWWKPRMG